MLGCCESSGFRQCPDRPGHSLVGDLDEPVNLTSQSRSGSETYHLIHRDITASLLDNLLSQCFER